MKHEEIESADEQRLDDAEITLRDQLRWVNLCIESAKALNLQYDDEKLRESLLLTVTELAMESEHIAALLEVEKLKGLRARKAWENDFTLNPCVWTSAKKQLDDNPMSMMEGGFF